MGYFRFFWIIIFTFVGSAAFSQVNRNNLHPSVQLLDDQSDLVDLHKEILQGKLSNKHDDCKTGPAKVELEELENAKEIIEDFEGVAVDPRSYAATPKGLDAYLKASGVKSFSGLDIVQPFEPQAAVACKLKELVPAKCRWVGGVALLKIADRLARKVSGGIRIRNWWRPACYNRLVHGAHGSDHVEGRALDIDFDTPQLRGQAQKYMCENYWHDHSMNLQIGIGGVTLHVGLDSPRGRRFWYYPSFVNVRKSGNCWQR